MRRARDIYAKAIVPAPAAADRHATLLVNRVLDPILKCGTSYKGVDVRDVAAAIKADPTSVEDFRAAVAIAYDVLAKVDEISELVHGRATALAS